MSLQLSGLVGSLLIGAGCAWQGSISIAQAQPAEAAPSAPYDKTRAGEARKAVQRKKQDKLAAAFAKMLSGATLQGSFTSTGHGSDATKLTQEKYTIVEAKQLAENIWLITARIQYGEHDATLPITVPIRWAGDTPVITIDNMELPGFGRVSARVMFFADHYAGYWKHGEHGGHLFGVIRRDAPLEDEPNAQNRQPSGRNPAGEKHDK
jgi:hypothetical protein